jgi:hypothetical protein
MTRGPFRRFGAWLWAGAPPAQNVDRVISKVLSMLGGGAIVFIGQTMRWTFVAEWFAVFIGGSRAVVLLIWAARAIGKSR